MFWRNELGGCLGVSNIMFFRGYIVSPRGMRMGNGVGLGGLGDPRFAGSNPAEVDGFFQDVKILRTSPPGRTLS